MFKKYLFCTALLLTAFSVKVFPSGIQVLNTTVTTNTDKKSAQVKFSLTWDHSWRLADGPKNWDAAWVFIKYRTLPGDSWNHAYIATNGTNTTPPASHKVPNNASMNIGNSIAVVGGVNTNVGVGAFIYRSAAGNGTITFTDVELNWDFAKNGLTGGEQVEVCVLATEMVYIPGAVTFYVGDYTSAGRLGRNRSNPVNVGPSLRAEEVVTVSAANPAWLANFSNTWMNSASYPANPNGFYNNSISSMTASNPDDFTLNSTYIRTSTYANYTSTTWYASYVSLIHANFPRGYNAFYCMKYEVTQGEYLQFLNKAQVAVKNATTYYPGAQTTGRFDIIKKSGTGTSNIPAEYELNKASSAYLPCNFLGTKEITAWLIWSGLRPMTELEFEKVCRGPETIPGTASLRPQYAWGSVGIDPAAGFSNKDMANEGPSNSTGNCAVATAAGTTTTIAGGTNGVLNGPMRAGGFATPVSSREKSGASYYGVMEMSGNLWERCISVGNDAGRAFQGSIVNGHGNGEVGVGTTPDLPIGGGWPGVATAGLGFKGGSYLDTQDRARISDRYFINLLNTSRGISFGGRGVRSAL